MEFGKYRAYTTYVLTDVHFIAHAIIDSVIVILIQCKSMTDVN